MQTDAISSELTSLHQAFLRFRDEKSEVNANNFLENASVYLQSTADEQSARQQMIPMPLFLRSIEFLSDKTVQSNPRLNQAIIKVSCALIRALVNLVTSQNRKVYDSTLININMNFLEAESHLDKSNEEELIELQKAKAAMGSIGKS